MKAYLTPEKKLDNDSVSSKDWNSLSMSALKNDFEKPDLDEVQ